VRNPIPSNPAVRLAFVCLCLCLAAIPVAAQSAAAQRALALFHRTRPTDDDLGMYRMDWEPTLAKALERSKAEQRPVCLVIIHAKYGDLYSGHC
jgi:hypothetical protein